MSEVTRIGANTAHISWAVFVLMLLVKLWNPERSWLSVFSPFLLPIAAGAACLGGGGLLNLLSPALGLIRKLLKSLKRNA